jgi:SAM-dependent methyltransferase
MEDKSLTADKFTALSSGWSEREYGDPLAFMRRRASLVINWGARLEPGDRILELGCGDGTLTCLLAREGFEVTGVDISPGMIEEARKRAQREGVDARFELCDSDKFEIERPFDAVVSFMSAFFTYMEHPAEFLESASASVTKKVIVDWNFRSPCSFVEAARTLERAGLHGVEWRPWFIRHSTLTGQPMRLRNWAEERPNLSLLLLALKRWHYTIYLKGEKSVSAADARAARARRRGEFQGNALPGSLLQRSLIKLGQLTR